MFNHKEIDVCVWQARNSPVAHHDALEIPFVAEYTLYKRGILRTMDSTNSPVSDNVVSIQVAPEPVGRRTKSYKLQAEHVSALT